MNQFQDKVAVITGAASGRKRTWLMRAFQAAGFGLIAPRPANGIAAAVQEIHLRFLSSGSGIRPCPGGCRGSTSSPRVLARV